MVKRKLLRREQVRREKARRILFGPLVSEHLEPSDNLSQASCSESHSSQEEMEIHTFQSQDVESCYNLQMFLDICTEHWPRWTSEVKHNRKLALATVSASPSVENIDALMLMETLVPQMEEVF